jgi:hypothetical protein
MDDFIHQTGTEKQMSNNYAVFKKKPGGKVRLARRADNLAAIY